MQGIVLDDKNNPIIVELKASPVKNIIKSGKLLEEAVYQLNQIYRQAPKTCCDNCGSCCDGKITGNPWVYSIEYLNITRQLKSPFNKELKRRVSGSAMMGKFMLKKKTHDNTTCCDYSGCSEYIAICPLFDPRTKLCSMYEFRPLICRLYGLDGWTKGSLGWLKQAGNGVCDKVRIHEDDSTEHWDNASGRSLMRQLKRLSHYYYIDYDGDDLFNSNSILDWLTLKM